MPIYKCPRCRGNDVYFANRQEVRSTGGPFGESYTVDVKKPFCRPCGEPMDNLGPTPEEARASAAATEKTISFITSKLGIFLIVGIWVRLNAIAGGALMIMFIIAIGQAWARGISLDCGCFGKGGLLDTDELPVWNYTLEIARDIVLAAFAVYIYRFPQGKLGFDK